MVLCYWLWAISTILASGLEADSVNGQNSEWIDVFTDKNDGDGTDSSSRNGNAFGIGDTLVRDERRRIGSYPVGWR